MTSFTTIETQEFNAMFVVASRQPADLGDVVLSASLIPGSTASLLLFWVLPELRIPPRTGRLMQRAARFVKPAQKHLEKFQSCCTKTERVISQQMFREQTNSSSSPRIDLGCDLVCPIVLTSFSAFENGVLTRSPSACFKSGK